MVDEVPTYKVILKDLSHLKSVTSVGFNVTEAEEAVAKAKKRLVGRLVIHTNVQEVKQLELFSQELETCSPNRRKTLTHAQHVVKKQLDKRKTELELIKKAERNHETDEKTSD